MAKSVRVQMNTAGAIALLKSPGVAADLEERARRVANSAGAGDHDVIAMTGKTRARVIVMTSTYAGRKAEATDRNLTRAIDAARG